MATVSELMISLLSALLATNQPLAVSNVVRQQTGITLNLPDPNDPVEKEFRQLMAGDDAAHTEVDQWIKENQSFEEKGAGVQSAVLNGRIKQRLEPIRKAYEDFLRLHPNHARALVAYASFLSDQDEEAAACAQLEKAREADPKNPAVWNQLANYYGHNGSVSNAFSCYEKAIALNPAESVYYHNLGLTTYLFRQDATNHYKISEQAVFEKAMALYRKALELDPDNFVLAADYAQSYYGYKPRKTGDSAVDRKAEEKHFNDAMAAWQAAFKLANDDIERQGVFIHFARLQINAGRFEEARKNLDAATNSMFNATRRQLLKKLESKEKGIPETGSTTVENPGKPPSPASNPQGNDKAR